MGCGGLTRLRQAGLSDAVARLAYNAATSALVACRRGCNGLIARLAFSQTPRLYFSAYSRGPRGLLSGTELILLTPAIGSDRSLSISRPNGPSRQQLMRIAIQLILGVVILGLVYVLYRTIVDPWKDYQAIELKTEMTRTRMGHVRTALTSYRDGNEDYPETLDLLVPFVKRDSALQRRDLSVVFPMPRGGVFVADSLPFSPRTGARFDYEVVDDDTSGVSIYYLKDPDSEDVIGSQTPNPALRNVASWE